jgi:hypothetical protein
MTRRRSLAPVTALLLIAAISGSTAEAQTHAASYVDDHGTLLTKIRSAVIKVIGTRGDRVEVAIAGDVLTVTRVNSTMNQTGHVARASEAARITAAVAATIAGEPEFKHVHTIRVLYVNRARPATHGKVIDAVNFKQDQRGAFVPHAT